jgi:hypothetical protein
MMVNDAAMTKKIGQQRFVPFSQILYASPAIIGEVIIRKNAQSGKLRIPNANLIQINLLLFIPKLSVFSCITLDI